MTTFKRSVKSPEPTAALEVDPLSEFEKRWVKDTSFKNLESAVKQAEAINIDTDLGKVRTYHKNRKLPKLTGRVTTRLLQEITLQEASTRSSIVTLVTRASLHWQRITYLRHIAKNYVAARDSNYLLGVVKTSSARDALIDALFRDADCMIGGLKELITFGETIIGDIDKAAYRLHTIADSLALEFRTEINLNGK
jgi:hypothetical protein